MRVDVLSQLLDKTINDPDFREEACQAPRQVLSQHGFDLTDLEFEAFMDFHSKAVSMSAALPV